MVHFDDCGQSAFFVQEQTFVVHLITGEYPHEDSDILTQVVEHQVNCIAHHPVFLLSLLDKPEIKPAGMPVVGTWLVEFKGLAYLS